MIERTPEQRFYDKNGYYERQTHDPHQDGTYLAWAENMTNRRRHCWNGVNPAKNNEPTRWLDHQSVDYIARQRQHRNDEYGADESWKICAEDHSSDPKIVGEIEWMRFIHEWGRIAPEGQRYFTDDGQPWICPTGQPMSDGRLMYAEVYFNLRPTDEAALRGFSFRPKLALFLANGQNFARMECYDEALFDLCLTVWHNVQVSYEPVPA